MPLVQRPTGSFGAAFKQSARVLDHGVGAVLGALDEQGLADETLVVFTTDHGLPFPGAKATLSDRGIGVLLIMRGPGGFHGGRVSDALISQIDLYPTLCDLAGVDRPAHLQASAHVRLTELQIRMKHESNQRASIPDDHCADRRRGCVVG